MNIESAAFKIPFPKFICLERIIISGSVALLPLATAIFIIGQMDSFSLAQLGVAALFVVPGIPFAYYCLLHIYRLVTGAPSLAITPAGVTVVKKYGRKESCQWKDIASVVVVSRTIQNVKWGRGFNEKRRNHFLGFANSLEAKGSKIPRLLIPDYDLSQNIQSIVAHLRTMAAVAPKIHESADRHITSTEGRTGYYVESSLSLALVLFLVGFVFVALVFPKVIIYLAS